MFYVVFCSCFCLFRNIEALVLAPGSTALLALEHTYSLLRRLILALPTALQTTYAASLVHTILAEVSVSTTNGKAFIEGALVSIFVHLDKSSALWGKMNPDLIQKCCEFGRSQLSTTGASASASATSAAAAVFRSPSKADFGASQLIALLINKVWNKIRLFFHQYFYLLITSIFFATFLTGAERGYL